MTEKQAQELPVGVYRLYWVGGDWSVAAVGQDSQGNAWFAPANWVTVPWFDWSIVQSVEPIAWQFLE